jgi:hypothetical protein
VWYQNSLGYCSLGARLAKYNSKNKNQNFEEITFSNFIFLHGEKENFGEYLLILEYAIEFSYFK